MRASMREFGYFENAVKPGDEQDLANPVTDSGQAQLATLRSQQFEPPHQDAESSGVEEVHFGEINDEIAIPALD